MLEPLPVTRVELELTEACNQRCLFCYNSCQPATCDHPETLFESLAEAGVFELILTGGEPSLHPRFFDVLRYATTLFPRVMVQSNGVNFADPVFFAQLSSYPIFCLNFSLHGPEAIHDKITGTSGGFRKTVTALTAAVKAGIRTASNLVLTALNAAPASLLATVEILGEAGVREMTVTRFIPCGLGKSALELSTTPQVFSRAVDVLREATAKKGISLLLATATPSCRLPEHQRDLCNRCSFGFDKFYVDVRGDVLTCGMARIPLGNLFRTPLHDLLAASDVYRDFRGLNHLPHRCRQCAELSECGGGCRAAALASGGEVTADDPFCCTDEPITRIAI